jgi:hypothetical protein
MSRSQRLCGTAIAVAVIFGPTIAADMEQGDMLSVRPFATPVYAAPSCVLSGCR